MIGSCTHPFHTHIHIRAQGHVLRQTNCIQLHKRAERIAVFINEKLRMHSAGDHIALLYPPGLELIAAFYACLYVGEGIAATESRFASQSPTCSPTLHVPHECPTFTPHVPHVSHINCTLFSSHPSLIPLHAILSPITSGVVPVVIRPPLMTNLPASLPTIKLTLEISNACAILTTHSVVRILKSKVCPS